MADKGIDVAQVMRDIRAEEMPEEGAGVAVATAAPDVLAPHRAELERLALHVEGTREQAAAHSEIGAVTPGGLGGFVARLVRRVAMFVIRPQTTVNHNVGAAVEGLVQSDRALLRAVDALRADTADRAGSLQARVDLLEKHAVPLQQLHSLSVENAELKVRIVAMEQRLQALEGRA